MSMLAATATNEDIVAHTSCFIALARVVATIASSSRTPIDCKLLSEAITTYLTLYKRLYGDKNVIFKFT